VLDELKIPQPRNATALVPEEAARVAGEIGLPAWSGRAMCSVAAMVIAYDVKHRAGLRRPSRTDGPGETCVDRSILEEATEIDVDALADGTNVVIGGIMEHIEEAGVHSGDSSCVLPPVSLSPAILDTIREYTQRWRWRLKSLA